MLSPKENEFLDIFLNFFLFFIKVIISFFNFSTVYSFSNNIVPAPLSISHLAFFSWWLFLANL